jgi:hypothetical protein
MNWPTLDAWSTMVPVPAGYRFTEVNRADLLPLIAALKNWYPNMKVGVLSAYLREDFYLNRVCLDGQNDKDIWAVQIMHNDKLVGFWSMEREIDSLSLYGRLCVLAPAHRGTKVMGMTLTGNEVVGQAMGAAFMYALITLKHPYAQRMCESAGYRLLGMFPGYDREEVAPGVVKRVYQAVYAKLLVPEDEVHWPDPKNLTPRAAGLFQLLFTKAPAEVGTSVEQKAQEIY